jgi:hypothetical protein
VAFAGLKRGVLVIPVPGHFLPVGAFPRQVEQVGEEAHRRGLVAAVPEDLLHVQQPGDCLVQRPGQIRVVGVGDAAGVIAHERAVSARLPGDRDGAAVELGGEDGQQVTVVFEAVGVQDGRQVPRRGVKPQDVQRLKAVGLARAQAQIEDGQFRPVGWLRQIRQPLAGQEAFQFADALQGQSAVAGQVPGEPARLVVGLVIDHEDVDAALARGHVRAPRAFLGGHARGEVDVDRLRH